MASTKPSLTDISERLERFKIWFENNGGWISELVEFKYTPALGVHLRAKAELPDNHIAKGTLIISCPHELSLSGCNAWHVSPVFRNHTPASMGLPEAMDLPEALLKNCRNQIAGAIWLIGQQKLGRESFWSPYVDLLPGVAPHSGANTDEGLSGFGHVNSPIWWTEEELSWLAGTNVEKGLVDLREGIIQSDWAKYGSEIQAWGQKLGWTITRLDYFWAITIFNSRAFSAAFLQNMALGAQRTRLPSEIEPDVVLFPGIDMLNHNPMTQNQWDQSEETFDLICDDMSLAGQEIHIPYGVKSTSEMLLIYGFAMESNPHDTLDVKLSRVNESVPPPRRATYLKGDQQYKNPDMRPVGEDWARHIFRVRSISGDLLQWQGYPSEMSINRHLLGFPYSLLNTLAADLELPRESRARAEQPGQLLGLRPSEPNRDNHIDVHARLGQRNVLAVTNILVQMLRFQLARLSSAELTNESLRNGPPLTDKISHSRWIMVTTFRRSQRAILEDNILLLSFRLQSALNLHKELLPLGMALEYMERVMTEAQWSNFQKGFKAALGLQSTSAQSILEAEAEEPAWALLLGVGFKLNANQRRELHRFLRPADSGGYWLDLLDVRYPQAEESLPIEKENDENLVNAVRAAQHAVSGAGFFTKEGWTKPFIDRLTRIVIRETLKIPLAGADVTAAGLPEDINDGEGVELVAMFVQ